MTNGKVSEAMTDLKLVYSATDAEVGHHCAIKCADMVEVRPIDLARVARKKITRREKPILTRLLETPRYFLPVPLT